uniref:Uncharacterized protein n=1 Tax=viral metagenome TaxID=1070528 RepID=A0A6M3JUH0_9ZZZZ
MAFTAYRTWVAGEIVTAALLNEQIRDNGRYHHGDDGVPTILSGLIIDNTDGDEYFKLPLLSTAECATVLAAEGEVAFDEQTHRIKMYNGSAVGSAVTTIDVDDTPVDSATTDPISSNWAYDFQQTLTTAGDTPYATEAGVWTRLGIGGSGSLAQSTGSAPSWVQPEKMVIIKVITDDSTLITGNGQAHFTIPDILNGMNLVDADAAIYTASSSGLPTIQLHNLTDGHDMLSTEISIDETELNSYTAVAQPVINAAEDDVVTGDVIRIDVDIAGTDTTGLDIILTFQLP